MVRESSQEGQERSSSLSMPVLLEFLATDEAGATTRIINLMAVDAIAWIKPPVFSHALDSTSIQLVLIILLVVNLSYSAVAGMALLFIAMPMLARAIRAS